MYQKRPFSEHFQEKDAGPRWRLDSHDHDPAPRHLWLRPGQQVRRRGREPGTQLRLLADHGIREDLTFSDIATGCTLRRAGWQELLSRLRPGDTLAVAFLDRLSRNFEDGVRIQADLTERNIGIVALRENIDTSDGSAAAKFFRRSMLAQGAYQVDSTSERIKLGLDQARAGGKRLGRPPVLTPEQVAQCRRMTEEGAGLRHIARVMQCSPATVRKALAATLDG